MADTRGISIKVETGKLISTAGDVEAKIQRLEQVFSGIEQTVNASRRYWEGAGADACMAAYRKKLSTIETAFRRFRENVTDLREIAGVYEQSERTVTANNAALASDWID